MNIDTDEKILYVSHCNYDYDYYHHYHYSKQSSFQQKELYGGNPLVVLNAAAIAMGSGIVTVALPPCSDFVEMDPVWGPRIETIPTGGTLRMTSSIMDTPGSNCAAVPSTASYGKFLGKLLTYLYFYILELFCRNIIFFCTTKQPLKH